jgi:hypothetical protein
MYKMKQIKTVLVTVKGMLGFIMMAYHVLQ